MSAGSEAPGLNGTGGGTAGVAAGISPESADAGRQVYGTTLAEGKEESHKHSDRPSVLLRHPVKPSLSSSSRLLRVGLPDKTSRERLAFHQRAKVDFIPRTSRRPFRRQRRAGCSPRSLIAKIGVQRISDLHISTQNSEAAG